MCAANYVAWGVIQHDDGIDDETVWLPSMRLSAPKTRAPCTITALEQHRRAVDNC
jgi:hypothetical protein